MNRAKLTSIDAVDALAAALRSFEEEAAGALADLDLEIKRASQWLRHDRRDFWAQEVHQGYDRVAEARANLERRMIYRVSQERPSAMEEKKALEQAKRRLEIAQHKVEAVRHWSYVVEHEMQEYVGRLGQLTGWLQTDLPKALATLKRMAAALEAYVGVPAAPEAETARPATRPEEPDEARDGESEQQGEKSETPGTK